jgi:regulator of cell morphogenesis and NO signaling
MKRLEEMTVGEVAAQSAASARVFEKHGITFCCAGQISVADACLARGLDPAELFHELEQARDFGENSLADWQAASVGSLIDHIVDRHHAYLKTQLPAIQARLEEVLRRYSARHRDVLNPLFACFRGMREELDARLMQQETVLFPLLRGLDRDGALPHHPAGSGPDAIQILMEGHDKTAQALAEMRRLTANYTPPIEADDAFRMLYHDLRELEIDLHRHFHLENNILFPRVSESQPERH